MKNDFAQLFIYIDSNRLIFGLLIPDETNGKKRFIENLKTSFNKEIIFQNTSLPDNCELHFSSSGKSLDPINPLGEWLKLLTRQNSRTKDIQASVHLEPNEVLLYSSEQLASQIKQTFESLFILFLTANFDDPIDEIRHYLNSNNNTSAERYLERGIIHYRENNYQRSIKRFNTAIERAPNLADAYSYRGQANGESHYRFHLGDQNSTPLLHELLIVSDKDVDGTFPQLTNRKRGKPVYPPRDRRKPATWRMLRMITPFRVTLDPPAAFE